LCDEFSMVGLVALRNIASRLAQFKPVLAACPRRTLLGDVGIVFLGDPGQLPPVKDTPPFLAYDPATWTRDKNHDVALAGGLVARECFDRVVVLTQVMRQAGDAQAAFRAALAAVRDGDILPAHLDLLNSRRVAVVGRPRTPAPGAPPILSVFPTRAAAAGSNAEALVAAGKPVAKLRADNVAPVTAGTPPDGARGLANTLFLAEGASVMCVANLSIPLGLFNGASGVVARIVYTSEADRQAGEWPAYIVTSMDEYSGPPFDPALPRSVAFHPITRQGDPEQGL